MHIVEVKDAVMRYELKQFTPEIKSFLENFPGFLEEENPIFPDQTSLSAENIRLSMRSIITLMEADSRFTKDLQTKFYNNAVDVIKKQLVEKQQVLLETLADENALIINHTVRPRLRIQSAAILDKLKEEPLLENYKVEVDQEHYQEAQRIRDNVRTGRTGLNVFGF